MPQGSLILPTTGTLSGLSLVQAINTALANVSSFAAGATDPSTLTGGVQAYSLWADESVSPNLLRIRNIGNTAWVLVGDLSQVNLGLLSQIDAQQQLYSAASTSGSADAVTASFTPAITNSTLTLGATTLMIRITTPNVTSSPTFSPNSGVVSAVGIVKAGGVALSPGELSGWSILTWDTTLSKWMLLNPFAGSRTVSTSAPSGGVNGDIWYQI